MIPVLSRDQSFSDLELTMVPLDVGGAYACVEWTVEMTHSASLRLPDGTTIEPSGVRIVAHGATVAEFEGGRICALRQYWDDSTVLDQLAAGGDDN